MSNKKPLPLCLVFDSEVKYVLSFVKGYKVDTTKEEYLRLTRALGYDRLNVAFSPNHIISTTESELQQIISNL